MPQSLGLKLRNIRPPGAIVIVPIGDVSCMALFNTSL